MSLGSPWMPLDYQWISINYPWISSDSPWISDGQSIDIKRWSMDIIDNPLIFMDNQWMPIDNPWKSIHNMDICGHPWISMVYPFCSHHPPPPPHMVYRFSFFLHLFSLGGGGSYHQFQLMIFRLLKLRGLEQGPGHQCDCLIAYKIIVYP